MRVTNSMVNRQFLSDLESNYERMMKLQAQVSTGRKFSRVSEAPFDAAKSLDIRKDEAIIEQQERNLGDAMNWTEETETGLRDINEIMKRIEELSIQGNNGSLTKTDRESVALDIEQNKENIVAILNKSYAGKYIFGGFNTRSAPLEDNSGQMQYNGENLSAMDVATTNALKSQKHRYTVAKGVKMDVSYTALDVIGSGQDNLLNTIDGYISNLRSIELDRDLAKNQLSTIKDFQDNNLSLISESGGKTRRIETLQGQVDDTKYLLDRLKADVEGVDQEEVIIKFKTAELVYQAALAMGSKIIQPSLVDYLR